MVLNKQHTFPIRIEKARPDDLSVILDVMRPYNMHHYPCPEMEELDESCFFVARDGEKIIGAAGYKVLSQTIGKTTLLAVLPEYCNKRLGGKLQDRRLLEMHRLGVKKVITNADRPSTIAWYKKHYGYVQVGTLKKICPYGDRDIDSWTTLELDLDLYMRNKDFEAEKKRYIANNEPHPLAPYSPLLINVCLTGSVPSKDMTEFVPVTPDEIIEDAVRVYDAGARVVHIHARNAAGKGTWKAKVYEKILTGIRRERPDILCCVTCSGRNWPEVQRRSEVLYLTGPAKPDMASLTLGSLNFPDGPSISTIDTIQKLAALMKEKEICPELEVFDLGMIGLAKYLERQGLIAGRKYFNLLLGSLGQIPATIGNLAALINNLPEDSMWSAAGIGNFQLPMNIAAIVAGGGVRVGIEDSIHYDINRSRLATNEELVRRIVRIAAELERPVATPDEARQMLALC